MGDESCTKPLLKTFTLVIDGKAQQLGRPLSQETCLLMQNNHFFVEKEGDIFVSEVNYEIL